MLTREPSTNATALDAVFAPRGVAVIGASRDPMKLSHAVLCNLLGRPQGTDILHELISIAAHELRTPLTASRASPACCPCKPG